MTGECIHSLSKVHGESRIVTTSSRRDRTAGEGAFCPDPEPISDRSKKLLIWERSNHMKDNKKIKKFDSEKTTNGSEQTNAKDEPMSGAQRSFLKALSDEVKATFNENLTKAQASRRIEELQQLAVRSL
jgi:hypothetical protein